MSDRRAGDVTNEQLHNDMTGLKTQIESLAESVLQIPDLNQRLELLETWRRQAESFQDESRADRARLREAVEAMPGLIEAQVKEAVASELTDDEYIARRRAETEQVMVLALRKVFNIKSVGAFFATLISIIVFAERVVSWLS